MIDESRSVRSADSHPATASESDDPLTFTMRFTSTPRGARLARRMAEHLLDAWGLPYDSEPHDTLTLVVAELCANAARHGRVPGRDFRLLLRLTAGAGAGAATVRVEVTDTRGEKPPALAPADAAEAEESGRGLLLVSQLADDCGWRPRTDGPGKTVWAQCTRRTHTVLDELHRPTATARVAPRAVPAR
ncbi:ATP-binding protein [Streptomyces sp. NPDC003023]|uniref:ATP-binding protein n=1 Tax=Streptomyces sp. NPDC003023 TaxID=3364675 RepID=UPI0036C5FD44